MLDKFGLMPKAKGPKTVLELAVVTFALCTALPISVSLFPQKGEIQAKMLEKEFWEVRNEEGAVIEKFYYNKGL